MNPYILFVFLFATFFLVACGGGSNDSPVFLEPEPPPVVEVPPPEPSFQAKTVGNLCNPEHQEIVERVVDVMELPESTIEQTWFYCNHYTPGYRDRIWKAWRNPSDCDQTSWASLIGCAQAWAFDGVSLNGGNVGILYIPPVEMDILIAEAQAARLINERPWNDIRCLWTPDRAAFLLAHEFNHAWNGFQHTPEMATADAIVRDQIREDHGEFLLGIRIDGCPQQRRLATDEEFIKWMNEFHQDDVVH